MLFHQEVCPIFAPHSKNANNRIITNLRQVGLFCFATCKQMKQVILKIDDSAYEKFMGMVSLCPQVEVVCESSITDVMNDRDQCMVYAIQTLRNNHVFRFGYDYTWVMMAINEGLIDDYERFRSPQAFLDYLYEIGIDKLPSRITLSLAYSKTFNHFPDWTFTDMDNPSEILRRKNVVRQFLSAFGTAKRGILNKILNK